MVSVRARCMLEEIRAVCRRLVLARSVLTCLQRIEHRAFVVPHNRSHLHAVESIAFDLSPSVTIIDRTATRTKVGPEAAVAACDAAAVAFAAPAVADAAPAKPAFVRRPRPVTETLTSYTEARWRVRAPPAA
jgi:hypothetical protein